MEKVPDDSIIWCSERQGRKYAFRLVQGERRIESKLIEDRSPTKKWVGDSFDEKKKVSAIVLPAGSKVRESPLAQPNKKTKREI